MEITQEMLTAAVKKAVALELFPKYAGEDLYLKHWEGMKLVLEVALQHANSPDACDHEWGDCPPHWSRCRRCGVIDK